MINFTDSEIEEHRQKLLAQCNADEGEGWQERYQPGTFGCHEGLHTACLLMNQVETELLNHGSVIRNPEWYRLAEQAHATLFNLYQAIGAVHLEADSEG